MTTMRQCDTLESARHGFTLIELLVVMSVIAILASFAMAGVMMARKKAKRTSAQIKVQNMAQGVQSLMKDKNSVGRPMLENVNAIDFPGLTDPFSKAVKIKIDWELCPVQPQWMSKMNPVDKNAPYFPRVNAKLRLGKDRFKLGSYEFKQYIDFKRGEIGISKLDGELHALDPWRINEYIYFCYYVRIQEQSVLIPGGKAQRRYLVDGILCKGADGEFTPAGTMELDEAMWSPDNEDDILNMDNAWKEINRYDRTR